MFNRFYKPIWQRTADGVVTEADYDEYVKFEQQKWFFKDFSVPWRDRAQDHICLGLLAAGTWRLRTFSHYRLATVCRLPVRAS